MLVLSRKHNEKLVIGDNIVVTVVEIRGGKVKLGIEAPPEVKVLRGELVRCTQGQDDDHDKPT